MTENLKVMLLFVIVDSKEDEMITSLLKRLHCRGILTARGRGTARNDMLATLGLDTERSVITCVIRADLEQQILMVLNRKLYFGRRGQGVAFTVDISSVGGLKTLSYLHNMYSEGAGGMPHDMQDGGPFMRGGGPFAQDGDPFMRGDDPRDINFDCDGGE